MRVQFLNSPVDLLSQEETVEIVFSALRTGGKCRHTALNVAKLISMRSDRLLHDDVVNSEIIGIDGMGIVWGARLLGISAAQRVAGIDLMTLILAGCAEYGFRPFFLGATKDVITLAEMSALRNFPSLKMAGIRDGYFRPEEEASVVDQINASGADCLFVGMPTPKKERFLAKNGRRIQAPFVMGVGGSFDVMAGQVSRAPLYLQRAGLEWLFRLSQEPRRLFWRYATSNSLYLFLLAKEIIRLGAAGPLLRRRA